MIRRRKNKEREDDYIGPAKGWAKFFHRLFLLVTFPLRKPLWTLLILLVLFLLPTFRDVKPSEVHLWYWQQLKKSSAQMSGTVTEKAKELAAELPQVVDTEPAPKKPAAKVVDVPVKQSRRKMFERAKSAPVVVAAPARQSAEAAKTQKKLDLVYLEEPKIISGEAKINNANEITVGGVEMFLFGVYADPVSGNGVAAAEYLRQTTQGQNVTCVIKAYTYQSIATALCRVGDIDLNHELVKRGYSKNVALD